MYFISAAVMFSASLALIVQVSLPYNKTGRASVLYSVMLGKPRKRYVYVIIQYYDHILCIISTVTDSDLKFAC
jgi:hypothetical protein